MQCDYFFWPRELTFPFARKIEWLITLIQSRQKWLKVVLHFGLISTLSGSCLILKHSLLVVPSEPGVLCNSDVYPNCTVIQVPQVPVCYLLCLKNCYVTFSLWFLVSDHSCRTLLRSLASCSVLRIGKCPEGLLQYVIPYFTTTPFFLELCSLKALLP